MGWVFSTLHVVWQCLGLNLHPPAGGPGRVIWVTVASTRAANGIAQNTQDALDRITHKVKTDMELLAYGLPKIVFLG